jgi:hypothetical protein
VTENWDAGPIRDGVLEGDIIVKASVTLHFLDPDQWEPKWSQVVSTKKATRWLLFDRFDN